MNLSYKKGGSRLWTLNLNRQKLLKELYAVQLIHMMKSRRDIINIDENYLNKNIRVSYSWLSKGKNWYLANTKFENNVSLISAIWTNGFACNAVLHETIKSTTIIEFLDKLSEKMRARSTLDLSDCIILMDNWSIHRSKLVRDYFAWSNLKVHFNVPDAPELAPI